MSWTQPTATDFKAYFTRDFKYAPTDAPTNLDFVCDTDINKAIDQAAANFNMCLFSTDSQKTIAFMFLAAFYMVYDFQTSAQGLASLSNFPVSSKSVGGVSVGYTIPERFSKDPIVSMYSMNGYGMKYLSLVLPRIVGQADVVDGQPTVG